MTETTPSGAVQPPDQVFRLWEAVRRTSHELVWELDSSGVMRFMNDAAVEILGLPPSELVGRSVFSVIHEDDVAAARDIFEECVLGRTGWNSVRVRAVRPDGGTPWVETSGVAHIGPRGDLMGFTATTRRLDADDAREAALSIVRQRIDGVLRERRLRIVWQPIFSLVTGFIVGVEALSRFEPGHGAPDRWFAEAFSVGRGVELELLAVETALEGARTFHADVYVSVNVSPETVASGALATVVEHGPVPAERLVIELTEHVSIENYEAVAARLDELRRRGARVAVDDAGAGFASFRHILELKPDIIKLDQSITRGLTDNPAQRALATAVVLFGMEVGSITITAEGVETAEDLGTVSTLGIDAAQGFHMAVPVEAGRIDWQQTVPPAWSVDPAANPGSA